MSHLCVDKVVDGERVQVRSFSVADPGHLIRYQISDIRQNLNGGMMQSIMENKSDRNIWHVECFASEVCRSTKGDVDKA